MKILLTGSRGQLGYDIQYLFSPEHEIIAHDMDLDITDAGAVERRIMELLPDLVINAAAYTNVDAAETDEDNAWRVNAIGPRNLALACDAVRRPLMHISTDFVFDGEADQPYTEHDLPVPVSVYGKSKFAGEQYVREILDLHYICRTSWLFGVGGPNFVKSILAAGHKEGSVRVVDDQTGSPTYSRDLARKLLEIAESGRYGTYHISNSGTCTWCGLTREIFDVAGLGFPVIPATTEEIGRPAPRPRYSVMSSCSLEQCGILPLRPYREALEEFLLRDLPEYEAGTDS